MKLHRIIAGIGVLLMLPILCLPAFAAEAFGTLNLRCSTHVDGERFYFIGDEFSLVKIADAEVTTSAGKPNIRYTVLPKYKELDCNWGDLSAEESHTKAKELALIAMEAGDCMVSTVTDEQGNASFNNLDTALYLVVRTKAASQNQAYFADPFLVSVPLLWEGQVNYVINVAPKYGWTPQDPDTPIEPTDPPQPQNPDKPAFDGPKLPQTGQLNWPIPVLLVVGSILILMGWKKYKQK